MEDKEEWTIIVEKEFVYAVPERIKKKLNLNVGDILTFKEHGDMEIKCESSNGHSFIVKFS